MIEVVELGELTIATLVDPVEELPAIADEDTKPEEVVVVRA